MKKSVSATNVTSLATRRNIVRHIFYLHNLPKEDLSKRPIHYTFRSIGVFLLCVHGLMPIQSSKEKISWYYDSRGSWHFPHIRIGFQSSHFSFINFVVFGRGAKYVVAKGIFQISPERGYLIFFNASLSQVWSFVSSQSVKLCIILILP